MTNELNEGHYDVAGGRQEFLAKLYDLVTGREAEEEELESRGFRRTSPQELEHGGLGEELESEEESEEEGHLLSAKDCRRQALSQTFTQVFSSTPLYFYNSFHFSKHLVKALPNHPACQVHQVLKVHQVHWCHLFHLPHQNQGRKN